MERLLQHPLQSAMAVFVLSLLPLVNALAGPFLALVTLRNGRNAGLIALVAGAAGTWLFTYYELGSAFSQLYDVMFLRLASDYGFLVVVALLLRYFVSLSLTLYVTTLTLCALVIVIQLLFGLPDASTWQSYYMEQQAALGVANPGQTIMGLDAVQSRMLFEIVAKGWVAMLFLATVLKLFLARWWQARLFNSGGFQQAFHSLRLTPRALLSLLPFFVGSLFSEAPQWVATCGVLVICLLALFGCGVVHGLIAQRKQHNKLLLFLFYGIFFLAMGQGYADFWILGVVLLAIADSFLNLRLRYQQPQ